MSWAEYTLASFDEPKGANPVVVLGHGFGCDSTCWHNLKPLLVRRGYGVLTYDLPYARTSQDGAFTESPNRRKTFRHILDKFLAALTPSPKAKTPRGAKPFDFARYSSLEAYSEDLICLLDEFRIQGCVFVGHSVSGMIGLCASTKRPDLFDKVIMLASSPRYINDASTHYVGGFEDEQIRELLNNVENNYEDWVSGFAPLAIEEPNDDAIRQFTSGLLDVRPDIALATCKTIFLMDLRKMLPKVTVSCVILQSKSDIAVPLSVGNYLANTVKGSSIDVLPTAGHLPHLSSPMLVNATLLKHIASGHNR